jgi:putative glutamine amidotransferase
VSGSPIIAIPGRFSVSASALRHQALVTARALSESVLRAGGEPVTVHPACPGGAISPGQAGRRLAFADAVLLPGGGDVAPHRYGHAATSGEVYDTDEVQDDFDLAVARWALRSHTPLLAVCRGMQVVNVACGGTLEQHMEVPHRHVVHSLEVAAGTMLAKVAGRTLSASCYHHQRVRELGRGLRPAAWAADGGIEAVEHERADRWFLGVQWHPEDTAATDPAQQALFAAFVASARRAGPRAGASGGVSPR